MRATKTKPKPVRHEFNSDTPIFRIRTGSPLKRRYELIAGKRGTDPSTVAKEGLTQFAASEENRLGIAEPAHPTTPREGATV